MNAQPAMDLDLIESVYDLPTLAADIVLTFVTCHLAEHGVVTVADMRRFIDEAQAVSA